ncbi:mediator of RNA polymerase II transcription subunit 29-like, partial [Stegodyphus dumicola]|uniref:mediator of RNA polymerase II transcription subunit 29-like n=1 Tax=Stegodyphus dumicola TaxID=202533 RepID=UPI0015B22D6E
YRKTLDDTPPRFDKTLEDFFSICNQIELHLKAIQECILQQKDSVQYLPLHVTLGKQDPSSGPSQDGNLSYTQYLSTIKGQVNFAKAVQEMLADGARKITQAE